MMKLHRHLGHSSRGAHMSQARVLFDHTVEEGHILLLESLNQSGVPLFYFGGKVK